MFHRQVSIVLMRPQGSFNIGATARAMQNMGLDRLVIVEPRCEIDVQARMGAAAAQGLLARRIHYSSLQEFYLEEGDGIRIAFTGKDRIKGGIWSFRSFVQEQLVPKLNAEWAITPIYLVFGSEDDGLSLEELHLMNWNVTLPILGDNTSLNLSQAVLLAGFILNEELSKANLRPIEEQGKDIITSPMTFDESLLKRWLNALGFRLEHNRRRSALDVIRNVLLRGTPSKDEFKLIGDVLQQNIRKLEERQLLQTKSETGFTPIGFLDSPFKTRFGTPRQPGLVPLAEARLKIRKDLHPQLALQGLEQFSHVWLLFQFHENTNKRYLPKIHPPRLEGQSIGVFATRSPHRPNPLGLSLVKLERIEGDTMILSGADLLHDTPVLDIKPYLSEVEAIPDAQQGWVDSTRKQNWDVDFDISALETLAAKGPEASTLQQLIRQTLERDPRPLIYKEMQQDNPATPQEHAVYLQDMDVHFKFLQDRIQVCTISFL